MKIRIFSEDYKDGLEVDWPAVPRLDEIVSFSHRGGTNNLKVNRVNWSADTHGSFVEVEVHLTY